MSKFTTKENNLHLRKTKSLLQGKYNKSNIKYTSLEIIDCPKRKVQNTWVRTLFEKSSS